MDKATYPIIGHVTTAQYGRIPILGIRMMSPEREKELGVQSAKQWKEAASR